MLPLLVSAGVTVDLHLYRYDGGYFAFPQLSFNNTTPNPTNTGYFAWGPTSTQTSGIHYELYPDGSTGGGSSAYNPFANFTDAIHGDWTLMVTNETSTNFYTFTVDLTDIEEADLPLVTITHPGNAATITTQNPLFTWTGPADWQGELRAVVRNSNFSYFRSQFLSPDVTSWSSPDALPEGPLIFGAYYLTNVSDQVSISTPRHNDTSDLLPGWVPTATIESFSDHDFLVSLQSGESHVLVGRYDFEDMGWLGEDSSGNGNSANGGSGWGDPGNDFDSDAVVGNAAGSFFGNGTVDWSNPSDGLDNLREALAGSFSVSAWIKTSASIGNDSDAAINGMTILWAYANPDGSIPLAITGSRLAFFTGAATGPGHTLHGTSDVNDDAYHHVVVTRNIRTGEKKIYVDGVLEASGLGSKDRLVGNNEKISLGGSFAVFDRSYSGLLDDLQLYRGVLNADDVAVLHDNPGDTIPDAVVTEAVAHYNFDGGQVVAQDVSGYDNDIELAGDFGGAPPEIHSGGVASSGSVEFFGNSFLTAPRLLLQSLARSFSISLWLNTSQTLGDENDPAYLGAGVIAADVPGGANDLIPIALTGGQVAFTTGGGADATLNSPMLVNDGAWHHVVVTRDQLTGEKKIYIDRVLRATGAGSTGLLNDPRLLTVGAISDAAESDPGSPADNGYNGYEGLLEDIQFYSGALSLSQVQFLYDNPGTAITNSGGGGGGNSLGEAVDAPALTWTTGGNGNWFHQTAVNYDSEDAAQSGPIGDAEESWIETTVTGPGTLHFWWKVSGEDISFGLPGVANPRGGAEGFLEVGDYLKFYLNGSEEAFIYGEHDWEQQSYELPPGLHELRWRYYKDLSGSAGADAGWLDQVVLDPNVSPDITFEPDDVITFSGSNIVLTVEYYGHPAPTIRWYKDDVLLPAQTSGTLNLPAIQTSDSGLYRMSASNHLGYAESRQIRITVYDPTDLRVASVSAPALAGSQTLVPIACVVTNTGPGFASNTVDQIYLVATNGDLSLIAQVSRPFDSNVPPGGTYTLSNLFRLPPARAGEYRVRVNLDVFNQMSEVNEANNSFDSVPITLINPDLQPGDVQTSLPVVGGLALQIRYNVTNHGPALIDGATWTDHIVLSTDNQGSEDDLNLLQPTYAPNIGVGQFISRTNNVTLPVVPPGNYFIVVRADRFGFDHGLLRETNETNNQAALAIQLTVPDLVPTNLLAPAQVSPRQPVNIEWHIQNIGDGVATAWNPGFFAEWIDRLYFSTNEMVNAGSVWTGDELIWNTPLPAGQFMTNSRTITVPNHLPEGDYFLIVAADVSTWVREINETNNQLAVPIRIASPDLVPVTLNAPALADAHSTIPVAWSVENQGAGDAQPTWRDRVYLSTNDTLEATDTLLGELERTTVTASTTSYSATNHLFLPGVAPGNYYLILRVDARTNLFESVVTNNYVARSINIAAPDLVVSALDAPTNASSQQPITVTYVVANAGAATAQPVWYERAFLSPDSVLDVNDVVVPATDGQTLFLRNTALPVGNSYTQQVDLRIPTVPAGDYFLLFQADGTNAFAEVNEANNFYAHPLPVFNPDLTLTNLIAPASVTITQLNERVEVGWQVVNQNTGTVQVSWSDYVYLSTDAVFDGSDTFIGNQGNALNLGLNQSYLAFDNPVLPNGIQGPFYLLVVADANGNVYESDEANNVRAQPLEIVIPPLPDLAVTGIAAPVEALSGQQIEITWVLTNRGPATAFGPFRERLYLTTAADGSGATEYGNFEFTGSIPPGGSVVRVQRTTLPITLSGLRWVRVDTDANNNLFEFDQEGNNSRITAAPIDIILAPTPNLVVTSLIVPPDTFSGTPLSLTWAVTNRGTGPTSAPWWYDAIYLSADTNFGGDTFLGQMPNAAYLPPGESYASAAVVPIPRGLNGTYHLFVRTDNGNNVFENLDEDDNVTMSGPVFINLTPPPDLRVGAVNPPLSAFSGQSVPVSYAITNHGVGQTLEATWWDRVYLSADTNIDGSDHILGAFAREGALESGAGYRRTNTVNLPVGVVGSWFFLVRADAFNGVYEVPFDANNDGAAAFATTIALTPPPDLATTILLAPSNAFASHVLAVNYRVSNEGATITPNSSWTDRLYLSPDPNFNAAEDLLVASLTRYDPLPSGAAYTRVIAGLLPDGLSGPFHVFVSSDAPDAVFELDNTNNVALATNVVTVISRPADLVVRALTAPAVAEAGAVMLVSWTVTNRSEGDSAVTRWSDRLVLSADDFIGDTDDRTLLDLQHDGLLGGTNEYTVHNALVPIPIGVLAGEHRLYLVTDRGNDVYEAVDETNNVSALRPITIIRQTADLQVTAASGPASAGAGGPLTVNWRVQNLGTRPPNTAYWVDSVYLSPDTVMSPSDILLGRRQNVAAPAPGGHYTNSLTATVPVTLNGDYHVIIVTDEFNQVEESGLDGNNQFVISPAVPITPGAAADLAITEVNAPTDGYSGQTFAMTYAVQNIGSAPANATWYDAVYLSLDHFFDPHADTYLGFRARSANLAPGASYTNTADFEIPPGFAGPFYVLVSTDASGQVYEAGAEANNLSLDSQAMQVHLTPPVDLVAGPITVPANAAPGVHTTIAFTIHNAGSNVARGSWEDALYISADTNYDIGDALFGRVRHVGDVPAGGSYSTNLSAPLPGVLPGDYHVIVRSDILNHVAEDNDTNNAGASLDRVDIDSELLGLGTPDAGMIAQGQSLYYKFNATAGTTVRVRFTTGVPLAGNEIYVSHGAMPTRAAADFAVADPFIADPDLFIPVAKTGAHYLLVYSGAMPVAAPYTILAEVLPFTVATAQPAVVGNQGRATFKLRGALFDTNTWFTLRSGTNNLSAERVLLDDSTTAYATFDLFTEPPGRRDLAAVKSLTATSSITATLSNAITVVPGVGAKVEVTIDGPLAVWARWIQNIRVAYGNAGDADAPAPVILVYGRNGTQIGATPGNLRDHMLQFLGRSLTGPPDILAPQSAFSLPLAYRGGDLHVEARIIRSDDASEIREPEWLELETSLRPDAVSDPEWLAFWANVRPRIGSTWADYARFINRFASDFPAEQRDVRAMFGTLFTNQPGFRASSRFAGSLLETNGAPVAGVDVALYRREGTVQVEGARARTDALGAFTMPTVTPGTYSFTRLDGGQFDLNRDGLPDVTPPAVVIDAGADLLGRTFYAYRMPVTTNLFNDRQSRLARDSAGRLHILWQRDEALWHAWWQSNQWVQARPISTNPVGFFNFAASSNLVDSVTPGLIAVWNSGRGNQSEIFYAVAQQIGASNRWSEPLRLTHDDVRDSDPFVLPTPEGPAFISYLKRNVAIQDDTDVYVALVNVSSTNLVLARDGFGAPQAKLSGSCTWTNTLGRFNVAGFASRIGIEGALSVSEDSCAYGVQGAAALAFILEEEGDFGLKVTAGGSAAAQWKVNPIHCTMEFDQAKLTGNFNADFTYQNGLLRILAHTGPPGLAAATGIRKFFEVIEYYFNARVGDTITLGVGMELVGMYTKGPAPFSNFRMPDKITSATVTATAGIDFTAALYSMFDFDLDFDGAQKAKEDEEAYGEVTGGGKATIVWEVWPGWSQQSATIDITGRAKWGKYTLTMPPINLVGGPPSRPDLTGFGFTVNPTNAIGSTNVHGPNSLLADVRPDVLRDGVPSLALDANGEPFAAWFREVDPFSPEAGSRVQVARHDGSSWQPPVVIPGSLGFNCFVTATLDPQGRPMVIWVRADTSSLSNSSTFELVMDARAAANVHYSLYEGGAWTPAQPLAATAGADQWLAVARAESGSLLLVWLTKEFDQPEQLLAARWDGTNWSTPTPLASGILRTPSVETTGGNDLVLWTEVIGRENGVEISRLRQRQAVADKWSVVEEFVVSLAPGFAAKDGDTAVEGCTFTPGLPSLDCCPCLKKKAKTEEIGNGPGQCVISTVWDTTNCIEYIYYKACPLVSSDPNDIVGPAGFGPEKWVASRAPLNYTIRFENEALATAPAKEVVVTLPLDPDFNPGTFRLGNFGFGDITIPVPDDVAFYQTTLDLTEERGFYLEFFAGVDVAKGEAFWRLSTIDPATGFLPVNPLLGFLPPNVTSPEGEGFLNFTIRSRTGSATGARLDAKATIVFDTQPPIDTPPIFNTVDAGLPASAVFPLPARTPETNFIVQWTALDNDGESGLAGVDVYVSKDGGLFFPWLEDTTLTQATFVGEYGVQYAFYTVATDNAGNVEPTLPEPDATILVASPNSPPVITGLTNRTILETIPFNLLVSVTDTDAPPQALTFELLAGPSGLTLGSTDGLLAWTPSESQGGTTNPVTLKVSDNGVPPLSATNSFSIIVLDSNAPPVFLGTNRYFVDELTLLTLTNRFSDTDDPTNQISLELLAAPTNATFDALSGRVTWIPNETQGPGTNLVIVRATDDAAPPASTTQTNWIIVREVNTPPVFAPTTNHLTPVLTLVRTTLRATDADLPTNTLTYSLGLGTPAGAALDPVTGEFRWTPAFDAGGKTNLIFVIAADNGSPALAATQQFTVTVPHFFALTLGETNLFAGSTSSVPVNVFSSAPWRWLSFHLDHLPGTLGQLELNSVPPHTTAALVPVAPGHSLLTFSNAPGAELSGAQALARFGFQATSPLSASVPLLPLNLDAQFADGAPFPTTFLNPGRVVIVADQPVLDAVALISNRHLLRLYGNPGETYAIETATNLLPPIPWLPFTELPLSNIVQAVEGETNSAPFRIYRALKQ